MILNRNYFFSFLVYYSPFTRKSNFIIFLLNTEIYLCITIIKIFYLIIFYFGNFLSLFINESPFAVQFYFYKFITESSDCIIFNRDNNFFVFITEAPFVFYSVRNEFRQL